MQKEYEDGFSVQELFPVNSLGLITKRDNLSISYTNQEMIEKLTYFLNENNTIKDVCSYFGLPEKDNDKWDASISRKSVNENNVNNEIENILYRPLDYRRVFYNNLFVARLNKKVLSHLQKENKALIIGRQGQAVGELGGWNIVYITNILVDQNIFYRGGGTVFPLYLYPESDKLFGEEKRKPNLNPAIVKTIASKLGLPFVEEPDASPNSPPLEGCPKGGVVDLHERNHPNHPLPPPKEGNPEEKPEGNLAGNINGIFIRRNFVENLPFNPNLKQLAKDKRKAGILSEVLFWQQVYKKIFHNMDFDRQRIIGNYIVDFYVKTLGLVIEIDGSSHDNNEDYDAERQAYLESLGLRVYRITDLDVKRNLSAVMTGLENYIVSEYGENITTATTTPPFGHPSKGGEFQRPEGEESQLSERGKFAPIDLLDYIYAVLHSPAYRERYKEFLKIDFPRVPYPQDAAQFRALATLGAKLRRLHLFEGVEPTVGMATYPKEGSNKVEKSLYSPPLEGCPKGGVVDRDGGRVWINDVQYFDHVPSVAYEFFIGGYQPAQKWLKDRKGRTLNYDDIQHYQKIIAVLWQTGEIQGELDSLMIKFNSYTIKQD
jgi:very-short-patch-repair endonuclease